MSEKNRNLSVWPGLGMMLNRAPEAMAVIRGSEEYPQISGMARFYQGTDGVLVVVEVMGLPRDMTECRRSFWGMHIHEGGRCSEESKAPFEQAKGHYNPGACDHPYHAGDLPPLLVNKNGYALSLFMTDRFSVAEIVGKTVIIHANPDDFTSQPAGNSGERIACGPVKQRGL